MAHSFAVRDFYFFQGSREGLRGKIGHVRDREEFNKLVRGGSGQLADKAKREEYERLIRQKKKTPPTEADEVPTMKKNELLSGI